MSTRYAIVAVAFLCSIVIAFSLPAQESGHTEHGETPAEEGSGAHSEASEHDPHDGDREWIENEIGVFLGATDEHGHSTEFTWGFEYIREVAHGWGVGGLFDYVGGLRNAVIGVPVVFMPGGRWKLFAAPCIEFHRGRGTPEEHKKAETHGETDENETHFLFRVGFGYDFIIAPRYSLVPTVNLDFVKGERVLVYGLNVVYKF